MFKKAFKVFNMPFGMLKGSKAAVDEWCAPQDQRFSLTTFGAASERIKSECEDPFIYCMDFQDIDNNKIINYLQDNFRVFRERAGTNAGRRDFQNIQSPTRNLINVLSPIYGSPVHSVMMETVTSRHPGSNEE